jgi:hypothetical protein
MEVFCGSCDSVALRLRLRDESQRSSYTPKFWSDFLRKMSLDSACTRQDRK